jgi:hypothetical protein
VHLGKIAVGLATKHDGTSCLGLAVPLNQGTAHDLLDGFLNFGGYGSTPSRHDPYLPAVALSNVIRHFLFDLCSFGLIRNFFGKKIVDRVIDSVEHPGDRNEDGGPDGRAVFFDFGGIAT